MRKFTVTVQFNIKDKAVMKTLHLDFERVLLPQFRNHYVMPVDENGVAEMHYTSNGNKNSSEESAVRGMKEYLRSWESFKRNYKILGAREITE